ncbi:ATP-binding protein [Leptolyngbya sp. PCC 6406]|uniref:GAF domain-containing sensor histidine kinase n=1 Tax=Leptolyngbya sp. PCC 6406 TaxID=1173264 RepID=UPI0002AC2FCA|nr:ATP-binding protein [Leptolyngbya sp. PCC 6406]
MNRDAQASPILETLPREENRTARIDHLLNRITRRILRSPDLDHTLSITATEVRTFLRVDRVKIYQFYDNGDGQVVAESIQDNRLPSLLGLNFPADDIPPHARELFMTARMRSIVNVHESQIGQGFLVHPETGESVSEEIRFRPVDPCHQEYLTAMGVQSSVVVPILHGVELWGLLVAHHSQPWEISTPMLQGLQMVVDQLAVAIAQAALWQQAHVKAQREAAINHISQQLYPLDTMDIPAALEKTVAELQGCGGRLYVDRWTLVHLLQGGRLPHSGSGERSDGEIFTQGIQPQPLPGVEPIEAFHTWIRYFQTAAQEADLLAHAAISDLYKVPELRNIQAAFRTTPVRGLLVVPLTYGSHIFGYLSIFRRAIDTETLWAGQVDADRRQSQPRLSFDVWKESKQGQAHPWSEHDRLLAQALGQHFAIAVQQNALYHQVQDLNVNLEQQVRDRTATLHRTLKELQETQTQLVQAEKMSSLGQLVASVAHEVNNPINFIGGNLNHARQYFSDVMGLLERYQQTIDPETALHLGANQDVDLEFIREDFPRLFASMVTGTERIQEVVRSLLNFSRHGQAQVKTVDLHEGIDSTLLILHYRMKARADTPGITVVKQYGEVPPLTCYASQINQVFMNLLSNAVQAIERRWLTEPQPQLGQIEVRTALVQGSEPDQARVEIHISDNGGGMAPGVREHIFEPFFTTKTVGQGTGLGLSICRQIVVDHHGGLLDCESTVGQGTDFRIQLPLQVTTKIPESADTCLID